MLYENISIFLFPLTTACRTAMISSFALGGIFGSLAAASLADKHGRKSTVFFNNVWATVATLLMTTSYATKTWYLMLLARLIFGFNAGSLLLQRYRSASLSHDRRRSILIVSRVFADIGVHVLSQFEQVVNKECPILSVLLCYLSCANDTSAEYRFSI